MDVSEFRDGMARLGSAVNVITTAGDAGMAGFTATAVCSVTDQPPTLLVCMNRGSFSHPIFTGNGVLCVNALAASQQAVSAVFADRNLSLEERFEKVAWSAMTSGAPAIDGALVSFDARITGTHEVGTHSVFFCEVIAIRRGDEGRGGLVYFNRRYVGVDAAQSTAA